MSDDWKIRHKDVINKFIQELNSTTENYILKGGTALMLCYNLNRFSEDIDLDSVDKSLIKNFVDDFSNKYNYEYRTSKDTDTTKRFYIHHGGVKPLKVEVSYRKRKIEQNKFLKINNINVYNINELAAMKSAAYIGRDRIRDLYDLTFICNHYWDKLNDGVKTTIQSNLEYKGIGQFDYLMNTQKDELIDNDKLAYDFLKMYDKFNLLYDKKAIDQNGKIESAKSKITKCR